MTRLTVNCIAEHVQVLFAACRCVVVSLTPMSCGAWLPLTAPSASKTPTTLPLLLRLSHRSYTLLTGLVVSSVVDVQPITREAELQTSHICQTTAYPPAVPA